MKTLVSCYLALALVGCGGEPFAVGLAEAGPADPSPSVAATVPAMMPATSAIDAGDARADVLEQLDAGAGDARAEAEQLDGAVDARAEAEQLDAGAGAARAEASWTCDPAYGSASPGGSCCVHVWATPTNGGVICTIDGSRWCWQTGMPCSAAGSSCVVQYGVTYCPP